MSHPYPAHPVTVVTAKGTDYEIGQAHAEAVGDFAVSGMPRFYFGFWDRVLSLEPKGLGTRAAWSLARRTLDVALVRRLIRSVPPFAMERVKGMADVTGIPYEKLATTVVLPDLFPMLQAYLARFLPRQFTEVSVPRFGCSSFLSRGKRFLVGRNLDFPGVAYWDRYPVLQVTVPQSGLKYVGFASAGVPFGGITGVNEAQVFVALHQHYGRETSVRGAPPFAIAEQILMQAKSARDAEAILRASRVASSWAFIVADGKNREGFIFEAHPGRSGMSQLGEGNVLAHSNFFQSKECCPSEYATTERMNWDNQARKWRLEQLIRAEADGLTPERAVQCLSDHWDPYWNEEKVLNRTISQVYNIQSVVLDLEQMRAWLAYGDAPIHLRGYQEWDIGALLGQEGPRGCGPPLPAYVFQSPAKRLAKESYILSFVAAFDGNWELARERLETSMQQDYSAEVAQVSGVLALKAHEFASGKEQLERARSYLEDKVKARGTKAFPPEYFEVSLYLARAHDLCGERERAQKLYRLIATHADLKDANLRRIARQQGPYRPEALQRLMMPYSSYVPFQ